MSGKIFRIFVKILFIFTFVCALIMFYNKEDWHWYAFITIINYMTIMRLEAGEQHGN